MRNIITRPPGAAAEARLILGAQGWLDGAAAKAAAPVLCVSGRAVMVLVPWVAGAARVFCVRIVAECVGELL